jgi:homocysteine S-methyltransferase
MVEGPNTNPILAFLRHGRPMVLDGGLATALEARGCDLDDPLWSGKVLLEDPDLIRQVHRDFLVAGADCITTSSYQATIPGLIARGLGVSAARDLLALSVTLGLEARDRFWEESGADEGRLRPLVAASVGPYAAYLADGSEYTGRYGATQAELYDFHRGRWEILAGSPADLLACETIPVGREVEVLLRLLRETPGKWAWMSFCCRDGMRLSDGSLLVDAVRACEGEPGVAAVGINCTAPEHVASLIEEARKATDKPILVYPNSGEEYEGEGKKWRATRTPMSWEEAAGVWVRQGASGVGGCCRVGPGTIAEIRQALAG